MESSYARVKIRPDHPDARYLQDLLSDDLLRRFGSDGRDSFSDWVYDDKRYAFLLLYDTGKAVGCGAIRPLTDSVAELKRMFALHPGKGIGQAVLKALEDEARHIGYTSIWLETRVANHQAQRFYERNAYSPISNYGKYRERTNAICYGKQL